MAQSLKDIIDGLSLSTGLKLCLDAGDINSYNPAIEPQKWIDTSGNGCDWFLGNDINTDASDPTFNGTPGGLSSNEYFDVGNNGTTRRFSYDNATAETWMSNLSKDGAVYTLLAVWKPQLSSVFQPVFNFGYGVTADQRGMVLVQTSSENLELRIYDSAAYSNELTISAASQSINGWNILLISWNEAGNYAWRNNANTGSGNAAYSRFGSFSGQARLFANLPANTLAAGAAIWEGVALTATQLTDLYNEINQRFNPAINPELVINASIEQDSNAVTADGAVLISTSLYTAGTDNTLSAEATLGIFDSFDDSWAINGRAINEDPFNGRYISDGTFANLVVTQESNSASSTASLNISATANETQEGNSVTSATGITVQASAALTQAGDSLTSSAAIPITSSLTAQQASNGLSSYSSLLVSAFANNTQNDNTLTAYLSTGAAVLDADITQAGNTISSQVAALIKADMDAAAAGDSLQALASLTIGAYIEAVQEGNYLTASVKTGLYRRSISGSLNDTTHAGTLTPHVSAGSLDSGYAGRSLTKRTVTGLLK